MSRPDSKLQEISNKIDPLRYATLVKALKKEMSSAKKDVHNRIALMYWRNGKRISRALSLNKNRADYGKYLFKRLAKSLNQKRDQLYRAVQFYRKFPIVVTARQLKWSHYELLITVDRKVSRDRLHRKAESDNLTVEQLRDEIHKQRMIDEEKASTTIDVVPRLPIKRGKLYHYRVHEPLRDKPEFVTVDLGFKIKREVKVKETKKFKIASIVSPRPQATDYILDKSDESDNILFTYVAKIRRIIDGDTLSVDIDCGFSTWITESVRLRSINAPERKSEKGQVAKRFVRRLLKDVGYFVIRIYGYGKYDRPLVDVFILPGKEDVQKIARAGALLNQVLLDKGLATLWRPKKVK